MRGEPQEMMEEKGRDYWGALLSLVGDWAGTWMLAPSLRGASGGF